MPDPKGFLPNFDYNINNYAKAQIRKGIPNGPFCTDVDEPMPLYDDAPCEKVIQGKNDSYIIMGRDRTSNFASGCGGAGLTSCGMIDIVVGRFATFQAKLEKNGRKPLNKDMQVSANFGSDAARVYITQKTKNIDEAFGFKKERGPSSEFKSAIGIKSDHTRIIGRESVRIYAGQGRFEGFGNDGETCSAGQEIAGGGGRIEFIAARASEDDLQPAVLGNKLKEYLESDIQMSQDILIDLQKMAEIVSSLCVSVIQMEFALTSLGRPPLGPFSPSQAIDSLNLIRNTVSKGFEYQTRKANYLEKLRVPGVDTILSSNIFLT
tara:strand:+ start:59 stop:1021 length:963 start_codon:yes stop_codon:yes gene_type:complete